MTEVKTIQKTGNFEKMEIYKWTFKNVFDQTSFLVEQSYHFC
jgi:hypothetical protein